MDGRVEHPNLIRQYQTLARSVLYFLNRGVRGRKREKEKGGTNQKSLLPFRLCRLLVLKHKMIAPVRVAQLEQVVGEVPLSPSHLLSFFLITLPVAQA